MDDDKKNIDPTEDVVYETDAEGAENASSKKAGFGKSHDLTIADLREKLAICSKEKQDYLDGWQRAKADLINARRRDEEERREFLKFSNERVLEAIIPVLESFDLAMGNKEAWEKADKNWRIGVEYIYNQLKKILEDEGLTLVDPLGETFNETKHEATEFSLVAEKDKDHKIIKVIQRGYMLNGKEMRPAKVVVGEFKG